MKVQPRVDLTEAHVTGPAAEGDHPLGRATLGHGGDERIVGVQDGGTVGCAATR